MMLKSDIQIREELIRELRWDPRIQIAVNNGVATLTGTVDSCAEWLACQEAAKQCEEAARRDESAYKVVNEIKVNSSGRPCTDSEIAQAAVACA